ncbi:hypothetical protein OG914_06755 [Streptomyces sp. NBC_00291]|uniref:hypothetical protein n=1 Tax=Streptomyces sp. NBC_00291 TaxID=2975704 RepID=UPI0022595DD7|nr:hypothetical protein [Streptomyces sp. NBC_00291]MCX5153710.1 hypothetical protein [Streptomyces sp. NBC_00291]
MPKKGQRLPWRVSFTWAGSDIKGATAHDSEQRAVQAALDMFSTARQRESELEITIGNRDTGETYEMTATHAIVKEVKASIERARSYAVNGADAGVIAELVAETEALLKEVKGTGSMKLRSDLRDELTDALKATAEPTTEEGAREVAVAPAAAVEGVVMTTKEAKLLDEGVQAAREAVALGTKMADFAKTVSRVQLAMRKKILHDGLPDLLLISYKGREESGRIYKLVAQELDPADVTKRDSLKALMRGVQNQNAEVLVSYLRGLDADKEAGLKEVEELYPDAAKAYLKAAAKATEEKPASLTEAVYTLYAKKGIELPRKGRAELARETRAAAKALASGEDSKLTAAQRLTNYHDSTIADLTKAETYVERLTTAAQKRKAKAELEAIVAKANEVLAKLS